MQNIVAHFIKPIMLGDEISNDYTILIPVFGDPKYLKNEHFLSEHKENVLLCINTSNERMRRFAIEKRSEGYRTLEYGKDDIKSPWQMFSIVLDDQLFPPAEGESPVKTTYAIFMDGDTYSKVDPGRAISAMISNEIDIASSRILPSNRTTLCEKLQGIEYDTAMLNRRLRPWLTSGACIIGRVDALKAIMSNHTRYLFGGDIEIGRLAKVFRLNIGHIDFVAYTEVPSKFRQLFRQRLGWWAGTFRTTVINADKNLGYIVWLIYYLLLVYVLLPGKLMQILANIELLPLIFMGYAALTIIGNWSVRNPLMLFYPAYAFFQVVVMPPLGIACYVQYAVKTRSLGRYMSVKEYSRIYQALKRAFKWLKHEIAILLILVSACAGCAAYYQNLENIKHTRIAVGKEVVALARRIEIDPYLSTDNYENVVLAVESKNPVKPGGFTNNTKIDHDLQLKSIIINTLLAILLIFKGRPRVRR